MSREIFRGRAYLLLLVLQTEDEFPVIYFRTWLVAHASSGYYVAAGIIKMIAHV